MNEKEKNLKKFQTEAFKQSLPSLLEKHFELLELVQPEFKASQEQKEKRMSICRSCPHFEEDSNVQYCENCRCLLVALIDFKGSTCPCQKWGPEE